MRNKRLDEVTRMFSYVSGKNYNESEKIILSTETGKAVQDQSSVVMYEQQTENLYSVVRELCENSFSKELTDLFTIEAITAALVKINNDPKQKVVLQGIIKQNPEQKEKNNELLKERRKKMLQQKQQNHINVRRMNSADKFKRENK